MNYTCIINIQMSSYSESDTNVDININNDSLRIVCGYMQQVTTIGYLKDPYSLQ